MFNSKNLGSLAALFLLFSVSLFNLMALERPSKQEHLVHFELVLFSDADAERIISWCKDRDFSPKLVVPEFGLRRIVCKTSDSNFYSVFTLQHNEYELPEPLKTVKYLVKNP